MRRSLRHCLLLLGILALPASTYLLSSCTLVNEPLVSLAKKNVGKCVRDCRKDFRDAEHDCARALHRDLKDCRQLPAGSAREACVREATEGFIACSNDAIDQRSECLQGCHEQGSGGGQ